jgi:F-type H+-transporting ATPase subunit c
MKKYSVLSLTLVASLLVSNFAMAEGAAPMHVSSALAFAAGLIMVVAIGVGTFSQSRAAVAALEGIARNPQAADKVFTPLILSLALIESLVIFGFAIAFLLQDKIAI